MSRRPAYLDLACVLCAMHNVTTVLLSVLPIMSSQALRLPAGSMSVMPTVELVSDVGGPNSPMYGSLKYISMHRLSLARDRCPVSLEMRNREAHATKCEAERRSRAHGSSVIARPEYPEYA